MSEAIPSYTSSSISASSNGGCPDHKLLSDCKAFEAVRAEGAFLCALPDDMAAGTEAHVEDVLEDNAERLHEVMAKITIAKARTMEGLQAKAGVLMHYVGVCTPHTVFDAQETHLALSIAADLLRGVKQ